MSSLDLISVNFISLPFEKVLSSLQNRLFHKNENWSSGNPRFVKSFFMRGRVDYLLKSITLKFSYLKINQTVEVDFRHKRNPKFNFLNSDCEHESFANFDFSRELCW